MGVYVGIMSYFQILKPHRVKEFLKVNEPLLRALVKEPPRTSNRGRKRIAERWVRVALVMIAKQGKDRGDSLEETGEREKLSWCDFLI